MLVLVGAAPRASPGVADRSGCACEYLGIAAGFHQYWLKGQWYHERTIRRSSQWSSVKGADISHCPRRVLPGKHRYLWPLDVAMRSQLLPLAQPYPKRAASILADAPTVQAGESGAAPTAALTGAT